MLDCCGWCYLFIFFIGKENENWGEKKKEKRENIAVRKHRQIYGFFFFGGKNKNFWAYLYE